MLFLDENPITCAMGTPISLYEHTLSSIKDAYSTLTKIDPFDRDLTIYTKQQLEELVRKDFKFSKLNRDWLVDYYNTLSHNYKTYCGEDYGYIEKRYLPRRRTAEYIANPLKIHKPTYDTIFETLVEKHSNDYKGISDIIELSRLMLLHLEPSPEEFPFGEPEWMKQIEYRDYISFDPLQKKFIKISRSPYGYKYFISYISDNWVEIKDVPKEIQIIVDHLLSKTNHD